MDIKSSEISNILKKQIKSLKLDQDVAEVGQVLSVGDGIARVYGLDNVQAGEMIEFPGNVKGMAENAIKLLSDTDLLNSFKDNAYNHSQKFDLPHILPKYEKLYQEVINII